MEHEDLINRPFAELKSVLFLRIYEMITETDPTSVGTHHKVLTACSDIWQDGKVLNYFLNT